MMDAESVKRLFVACPVRGPAVEGAITDAWKRATELLPPGCASSREEDPHMTLRFLGATDLGDTGKREAVEALMAELRETACRTERIPLILGYLATFPGLLWVGVGGTVEALDALNRLQGLVDRAVMRHGWGSADYSFLPHITVGRFDRKATDLLRGSLMDVDYPEHVEFDLAGLELQESVRDAGGKVEYVPVFDPASFRNVETAGDAAAALPWTGL